MSVLEQAQQFLGTKQGKVIAVGAAGGLVYLYWTRGRAGAPTDDPGAATTIDRVPGAVTGGNDTVDESGRPETNQQWLDRALSALTNPPYNYEAGATYNALRLALEGSPITTAQQAIVSKAISIVGSPPEGMPPTNVTAPDGSTDDDDTDDSVVKYANVKAGWHVDQWIADYRRQFDSGFSWEILSSFNPQVSENINWVNPSSSRTFKRDATYRVK